MQIIYEDKSILVINKPSGVLSIADGYDLNLPHLRSMLEPEFGRLWIVHRLDKETSGVMLLARSPTSHRVLNQQFTDHSIKKQYLALVFGHCPETFANNTSLRVNGDRRHRTVADKFRGKPACTKFTMSEFFPPDCSMLSAYPKTGFSHQIRAHLFDLGYPILGDHLYCTPESESFLKKHEIDRVALHAASISFLHPESSKVMTFQVEIPPDFSSWINKLKEKRASD